MSSQITDPAMAAVEHRAARLGRHARWSAISGLTGFLLWAILVGLFMAVLQFNLPGPGDLWSKLIWVLPACAIVAGLIAIALGASGLRRDNTYNRTLAFIGLLLGILTLIATGATVWMIIQVARALVAVVMGSMR